jgi:hypothetical protein
MKDIVPKPLLDPEGFHSPTGYENSQLELIDLFKLESKEKWTRGFALYDPLPKFFFSNTKKFTTAEASESKRIHCDIARQSFEIVIEPARVIDAETPFYAYPGEREELVARAIRYLATQNGVPMSLWEKSGKGALIRVAFTLHQIIILLKKWGHTFNSREIDEALKILQKTALSIKNAFGKTVFSGNLLSSYMADGGEGEKGQRRIVTLNEMEAVAIMRGEYRALNFERVMSLKDPVARRIYEFLMNQHTGASMPPKEGQAHGKPFELRLSQIMAFCGIEEGSRQRKTLARVRSAFDELQTLNVFSKPWEEIPEYDRPQPGKPGRRLLKEVIFLVWLSASEVSDIIKANGEAGAFNNEDFLKLPVSQRTSLRKSAKTRL